MLRFAPAVFAVGNNYMIIVNTDKESFVDITVGGRLFTDDSNGILRSAGTCHKFTVPGSLLDEEKSYTVGETPVIKRKAYFSVTGKREEQSFDFYPVPSENCRMYHIADAHNNVDGPVKASEKYGKIDLLILNGDIPEDSGKVSNFDTIFDICSRITGGRIPCVFARGNHDLRGVAAEFYSQYTPDRCGYSYYSFRLGSIWGLCLDCGEDKPDSNEEYGGTVACHQFRVKETEYIREIIKNSSAEYEAEGVEYKLIIVHSPFIHRYQPPFDIEEEIFREWASLLRGHIKPDLMLCGHEHRFRTVYPGDEYDTYGLACPMLVASKKDEDVFGGAGIELSGREAKITFAESPGDISKELIKL